jgi:hypothetical protein
MNSFNIPNINKYNYKKINGSLVGERINPFVDESTLFRYNLLGSKLVEFIIDDVIIDVKKYMKILKFLYLNMNKETILQNTTLNISIQEINDKGFKYYENLGLSIQGADARRTLKEIINIIRVKKSNMEMTIKLKTDEIVCFIISNDI